MPRNEPTPEQIERIVRWHKPRGWKVIQEGGPDQDAYAACDGTRVIRCPVIRDLYTLGIFFHEVGHVVLGHADEPKLRHIEEYEAERFATNLLRAWGFFPTPYWHSSARANIQDRIKEDQEKGLPIDPKIRRKAYR